MYKTQKEQKIDASSARNIVVEALMVAGTMIMTYYKSRIILFTILDSARQPFRIYLFEYLTVFSNLYVIN